MATHPEIFIIYKESSKSKKFKCKIIENTHVDVILDTTKKKPLIPTQWELEAILVGNNVQYINLLKRKFKIK